jgi:hypothetical protein
MKRRSGLPLLTDLQQLDQQASQLIMNALERSTSQTGNKSSDPSTPRGGSFFSSMMGGLSISLSRTGTNDSVDREKERGRSALSTKQPRSSSHVPPASEDPSRSRSRARSQSPFSFRRFRQQRDPSPTPQAVPLASSDIDVSDSSSSVRPRTAFTDDADDSGDETAGETDDDDDDWSDDDMFDPETEANTERNAIVEPVAVADDVDADPVGEGVNVVVPPDPYFPSSIMNAGTATARGKRNPRRRKSTRPEPLPLNTSRPIFQRDRCTITISQGDPDGKLGDRRRKRYIVASDLSEESRYAVEWGIGTVIRDGDEMMIVNILENEAKGTFFFLFLGFFSLILYF